MTFVPRFAAFLAMSLVWMGLVCAADEDAVSGASPDYAGDEGSALDWEERPGIGVGAGAVVKKEPYVGIDSAKVIPFPVFRYVGKRLAVFGPNVQYRLVDRPAWSFKGVLGPTFDGYEASDSAFLTGMEDRRGTVEGGFDLTFEPSFADFSLAAKYDLLGKHKGYQAQAEVSKLYFFRKVVFAPQFGYTYWNSERSDYYFGVTPGEATPIRPAYQLGGTNNWTAGIFGSLDITKRVFMLWGARYFLYDNTIQDSPIVADGSTWRLFLGFGYQFDRRDKKDAVRQASAL